MFPRCLLVNLLAVVLFAPLSSALAVQDCPAGNDLVTPASDFVDNGDGTIIHTKTGLMWKRCNEGVTGTTCGTGAASAASWASAQGAALAANVENFAGHADWRLPNVKELQSLVETGCYGPSINITRFPNASVNRHWTGTSWSVFADNALWVDFQDGFTDTDAKSTAYVIRLVRGGLAGADFDSLSGGCSLDVDGNGTVEALADGMLLLRAMFGLTGTAVTNGAVGGGATRSTWTKIRAYLNGSCGGAFAP